MNTDIKLAKERAAKNFKTVDTNGDGKVSLAEYQALYGANADQKKKDLAANIFKIVDADKSGFIDGYGKEGYSF